MTAIPLSFLAPVALVAVAVFGWFRPGRRPGALPAWSEAAALAALGLSLGGLVQYLVAGPNQFAAWSWAEPHFKADLIGISFGVLVAFIGWIVTRYSRTYLDGEAKEGAFHGLMLATLAAVLALTQTGSMVALVGAAIAVGFGLKRLLLFYPSRPEARRASTKFALAWHMGDAALIGAAILLIASFGAVDFGGISTAAEERGLGVGGQLAVALVVLAAILKTAALPLHGWLTEVMEAPTPVSALLHAGIINSGGIILIKTAPLVQSSPSAMAALVMLGGFTALFGAVVMLTQSAIKTALAWSTIAQMGFMLFQCGLGLWTLALLHLIAHSLYKAHAFLSSGSAVSAITMTRRPGPVAVPGPRVVLRSFVLATGLYVLMATLFTLLFGPKSPQTLALGAILVLGVAYLVAQGLADLAPVQLTRRLAIASVAAAVGHFGFQAVAIEIWGSYLPPPPDAGPLEWTLIVLAIASFGLVALAQTLIPLWAHHPSAAVLRVHLANGLYLNALLDRAIGGFRTGKPT